LKLFANSAYFDPDPAVFHLQITPGQSVAGCERGEKDRNRGKKKDEELGGGGRQPIIAELP